MVIQADETKAMRTALHEKMLVKVDLLNWNRHAD